jgi:two-component system cell cycle response regulator
MHVIPHLVYAARADGPPSPSHPFSPVAPADNHEPRMPEEAEAHPAPAPHAAQPANAGASEAASTRLDGEVSAAAPSPVSPAARLPARVVRGVAVIGLLAYAAHSLAGLGGRSLDGLFENWVFNGLLCAGAALCVLRAACSRSERAAWSALGTGLGCWAIGEILFTLDPGQVTRGSFPGTSDFLWLAFYPASFLTLGLLVRARVRQFYPSLWLDGAVGALAVGALASQFILPPIIAGTGGSLGSVIGDLVYPLGDLVLLGFVVAVLALTGWRPGRVLGTVALGLALGTLADGASLYLSATGHSGSSAFDLLWPASAVTLGIAAWQPARPSAVIGLHGRRLLVFPLTFALVALGLLALQQARPLEDSAYVLAVATIALAIARLGLTFAENVRLVDRSRHEALTDPLTGLGNRRRLLLDLEDVLQSASARAPWALLLLDLNGFKRYNDDFGHPVGDALLARLGAKLAEAVAPEGQAFRLGGDEFCVLSRIGERSLEAVSAAAVAALCERGTGFDISTACGAIALPAEAQHISAALALADRRLYADKRAGRPSDTVDQLSSVLMQVIAEREPDLPEHLNGVADMAKAVGRRMGLEGEDLDVLVRAAVLHDVGKVAVPEAILQKPARLDPGERAIIERHSEVGERILAAAPAMVPVAGLVRASHERFDGRGYPDRRRGEGIPLGARIIAVCDAYHAMTSDRPYQRRVEPGAALAELRRAAGSQFDPAVVEMFCAAVADGAISAQSDGTCFVPTREQDRA